MDPNDVKFWLIEFCWHFVCLFQRVGTVRRAFRQQLSDAIARVAVLYNVSYYFLV